jgi:hypothetical protein
LIIVIVIVIIIVSIIIVIVIVIAIIIVVINLSTSTWHGYILNTAVVVGYLLWYKGNFPIRANTSAIGLWQRCWLQNSLPCLAKGNLPGQSGYMTIWHSTAWMATETSLNETSSKNEAAWQQ